MEEKKFFRSFAITPVGMDGERKASDGTPTIRIAISSETPYPRAELGGLEILGHRDGEPDLSFMKDGAPFLLAHNSYDPDSQVGALENVSLDADRVLRADILFSDSERAQQILRDMQRGIRRFISVGYSYRLDDAERVEDQDGSAAFRVTRWTPYEASSVSIPADSTVGVGRSKEENSQEPKSALLITTDPTNTLEAASAVKATTPVEASLTKEKATMEENKVVINQDNEAARRSEAKEIVKLCKEYGFADIAGDFVAEGASLDAVKTHILNSMKAKNVAPVATSAKSEVKLTEKEQKQYSLINGIKAQLPEFQTAKGFEWEITQDMARGQTDYRGGLLVPPGALAGKRDANYGTNLYAGSPAQGGSAVFTQFQEWEDVLRPYTTVLQAGARVLPGTNGPMGFPTLTATADASWTGESAPYTKTTGSIGITTLSPHRLQAGTGVTREFLALASIPAEQKLTEDLTRAIGVKLDAGFFGITSASNQPTGLYQTSAVKINTASTGSALSWNNILQHEANCSNAGGDFLGNRAFVTTPTVRGNLKNTLKSGSVVAGFIVDGGQASVPGSDTVAGYPLYVSTNVGKAFTSASLTNLHGMVFGPFRDAVYGIWGGMEIIVDQYSNKYSGVVDIAAFMLADVNVLHPAAWSYTQNIVTF